MMAKILFFLQWRFFHETTDVFREYLKDFVLDLYTNVHESSFCILLLNAFVYCRTYILSKEVQHFSSLAVKNNILTVFFIS